MTDIFTETSTPRYRLTRARRLIRTLVRRITPKRIGLRNRILLIFVAGALILSIVLASITYSFTRANLVEQRINTETNQALTNARRAQNDLILSPEEIALALDQAGNTHKLIFMQGQWSASSPQFLQDMIPDVLLERVQNQGRAALMIVDTPKGEAMIVGIPLPRVDALYFEFDNMREVRAALQSLQLALLIATVITTMVGVSLGLFASRRAVRPSPTPLKLRGQLPMADLKPVSNQQTTPTCKH